MRSVRDLKTEDNPGDNDDNRRLNYAGHRSKPLLIFFTNNSHHFVHNLCHNNTYTYMCAVLFLYCELLFMILLHINLISLFVIKIGLKRPLNTDNGMSTCKCLY